MRYAWVCSSIAVFSWLLVSSSSLHAAVELEPIVKEGAPGDVLLDDPVIPAHKGSAKLDSPTGSVHKSLSDALPLPVAGTGMPGNSAQFRGYGRSAEDTNVQAFGVPLNPGQGGGFDLAIFPQFLWESYRFQAGPALGTLDPRATAGSLTLVPWTACALAGCRREGGGSHAGAAVLASTARLQQVSLAATDSKRIAVVAGSSSGDAQGPSLSLSSRWMPGDGGSVVSFHLLATDLDARTPGPEEVSPHARQRTMRVIPLVQLDLPIGARGLLKSSVFYDWAYLRYEDPAVGALPLTQDRVQQAGTENVLVLGAWKLGAGARAVRYATIGRGDLQEAIVNFQVSRAVECGSFVIEPVARGVGVTRYGLLPEASLGVRQERGGWAWFARPGLSRRFPSLVNRYYSYPGFPGFPGYTGNPEVRPERDWTVVLGSEYRASAWEASLQVFAQYAEDAQVRAPLDESTETLVNRGRARIASLTPAVAARVSDWVDLGASATLSVSEVSEAGGAYPGLPGVVGLLRAVVHAPDAGGAGSGLGARRLWEGRAVLRSASAAIADVSGNRLPPYTELNLEAQVRPAERWRVTARLENALDRRIELVRGFPNVGRALALLATAEF